MEVNLPKCWLRGDAPAQMRHYSVHGGEVTGSEDRTSVLSLDIGCGRTWRADILVDVDPEVLPTIVADASKLPLRQEVFSQVSMFHVLEHTRKPEEFLDEAHRVLAPKGRLVVIVPNWRSWKVLFRWVIGSPEWGLLGGHASRWDVHHYLFTKRSLEELLQKTGFRSVHVTGEKGYFRPAGWLPFPRNLLGSGERA